MKNLQFFRNQTYNSAIFFLKYLVKLGKSERVVLVFLFESRNSSTMAFLESILKLF